MTVTDESIMIFGKHVGKKMSELPESYLDFMEKAIKPLAPNKRTAQQAFIMSYIESKKTCKS